MQRRVFLAGASALPFAAPALAQENFPSRAVSMVVAFPPGGQADLAATSADSNFLSQLMSRSTDEPGWKPFGRGMGRAGQAVMVVIKEGTAAMMLTIPLMPM